MKKIFLFTSLFFTLFSVFSQEITGEWSGTINVMGQELPLIFHIEKSENGFTTSMDSPKQKAFGIPMAETHFSNDSLFIKSGMGFSYSGILTPENNVSGEFVQNGQTFALKLGREKIEIKAPVRPQTPKKPYPYITEDVSFKNESAGINLAGTLTFPKGTKQFPAVILISGSGPQNRNEEILDHNPYWVLSDYLTRNGIAVLRYDDRGVGESGGEFLNSTSADFATDAKAAIDYLMTRKEINKNEIGIIGHSEGGMIAPMVAVKSDNVNFIILLAAPGIPGDELLLEQNYALGKAAGMSEEKLLEAKKLNRKMYDLVKNSIDKSSLNTSLTNYFKENFPELTETEIQGQLASITMNLPWWQFLMNYDPAIDLEKVKVPVLAINGENDLQVPAEMNLNAIKTSLDKGGNKNVTIRTFPGLNHLFQESETGLPSEYGKIEQTFAPQVMELIAEWIKKQTK